MLYPSSVWGGLKLKKKFEEYQKKKAHEKEVLDQLEDSKAVLNISNFEEDPDDLKTKLKEKALE